MDNLHSTVNENNGLNSGMSQPWKAVWAPHSVVTNEESPFEFGHGKGEMMKILGGAGMAGLTQNYAPWTVKYEAK